jgi:SAM-dependent methyltransferase
MFNKLTKINTRPEPFEFYTAKELWTQEHTSSQMLNYHLNGDVDISSRNHKFIDKSVRWMTEHFNINKNSTIADFGCGPGLYSSRLASEGARVVGIDFSKRSIDYAVMDAKNKNLETEYICDDYLEFKSSRKFNIIIMVMCDFCALSPSQRARLLGIFHDHLEDDGKILFDVYSLNAFQKRKEVKICEENLLNGFWSENRYFGFQNTMKYEEEKVVLDKYTIIEKDREQIVYNWLQYFSLNSLSSELADNRFGQIQPYGDIAGSPFSDNNDEFAIVAGKK